PKNARPYGAGTHVSPTTTFKLPTPVNKKRHPTTTATTTKSTTRQRAVSLPQPQPYMVDGEHLSPVQLFEKWSGGAGKSARVHYNPRWSSFKYNTEKRPLAFCNPTINRQEASVSDDRIRTFTVDGRGKLIDKVDDLEPGLSSKADDSGCGGSSSPDPSPNVMRYKIWVAGAPEVGKTSLINQFANCELSNVLGRGDSLEDETGRIVNILINGTEIELSFVEQDIEESSLPRENGNEFIFSTQRAKLPPHLIAPDA
uniref:Uncharacterized protein n=1 Tax=Romanomermis culicivorax TaxID=13658 RepID=A0A915JF26_ROMCU